MYKIHSLEPREHGEETDPRSEIQMPRPFNAESQKKKKKLLSC